MQDDLKRALDAVRAKRGMPVRLSDKEAGSTYATRGEQPRARYRPSKSRKRSQKDIDARKRWVEKKKAEGLDVHSSELQLPLPAQGSDMAVPAAKVNLRVNPPEELFITPSVPSVFEQRLTREQAVASGHVLQKTWGVWQYRVIAGADWISCRIEGEPAPAVMTVRRPDIAALYFRPQPAGLDRRCDHAKKGLPPDGSCTGNCDGRVRFE